jgi:hypothetical protein
MILYKYKAPIPFEHVADILINKRLYCCPYYDLNDPFEGIFLEALRMERSSKRFLTPSTPDDLMSPEELVAMRVCSLSSDGSNALLWSLYAQRLQGVCFEIDCSDLKPTPVRVKYPRETPIFEEPGHAPSPVYALSHKREEWQFEKEYRLIGVDEYVLIQDRIRRVILGPRCNENIATIIRKITPPECEVCNASLDLFQRAVVVRKNRRPQDPRNSADRK